MTTPDRRELARCGVRASSAERTAGGQQAALARLLHAVGQAGGLAVLCGPGGAGVSTVLGRLAAEVDASGGTVVRLSATEFDRGAAPLPAIRAGAAVASVVTILLDDAHRAADGQLGVFVRRVRDELPAASMVLAGQGRLLTLLAREGDLGGRAPLRATVRPWSAAETEAVVTASLEAAGVAYEALVPATIHEIAAGIPRGIFQLLETALLVTAVQPARQLQAGDLEQMHESLSLAAA